MEISEKIRKIRQAVDLTQKEFSEKTGIPVSSLRNYEQGVRTPNYDAIEKIHKTFPKEGLLLNETAWNNFDNPKSAQEAQFKNLIDDMTEEQLDQMIAYAKFLHSQRDE